MPRNGRDQLKADNGTAKKKKKKCTHKQSHLICAHTELSARKVSSRRSDRTDDERDASSFGLEKSDKVQKSQLSTNLDSLIADKNPLTKKDVQDALVKKIHDAETAEEKQAETTRSLHSKVQAPGEQEDKKQAEDEEATKSVVTAASMRVDNPPSRCSKLSRRDEPDEVQKSVSQQLECEDRRTCSRRSSRRVEKQKSKIEKSRKSEVQQLSQVEQKKPQKRSRILKMRPIKIKTVPMFTTYPTSSAL
ncbi:hypothetical protein Aduo_016523 [Ancylostoma duodenale]